MMLVPVTGAVLQGSILGSVLSPSVNPLYNATDLTLPCFQAFENASN